MKNEERGLKRFKRWERKKEKLLEKKRQKHQKSDKNSGTQKNDAYEHIDSWKSYFEDWQNDDNKAKDATLKDRKTQIEPPQKPYNSDFNSEDISSSSSENSFKEEAFNEESLDKENDNQQEETAPQEVSDDIDIYSKDDEEYAEPPKEPPKKKVFIKSKKNTFLFRIIWIIFLSLVSTLLAGYFLIAMNDMLGLGESDNIITVDIPEHANIDTVAKIFKEKGIIKQELFFKLYSIITKNSKGFVAGTYELKANMDYQILINRIRSHIVDKNAVEIAFKEGMNVQEYASILAENGVCEEEEFLAKCNSDEFDDKYEFLKEIKNKDERYYKLEGYLFPDTYEFYKNEDPTSIIKRFLNNAQRKLVKLTSIEGYANNTSIKYICEEKGKTLDEILNISSMIQDEAANKDDMYKVSSVIYNRLGTLSSNGINKFGEYGLSALGIDSTVWYPYRAKSAVPENIVNTFKSRYNTYNITGTPPGPICNPGIQAIYAALSPENTEYFYFCHSSSGNAYYAKTNDVHLENLKKAGLV